MLIPPPGPLVLSRKFCRLLIALNLMMGFLIAVLLIASLLAEGPVMGALGVRPGEGSERLIRGMQVIALLGMLAIPPGHVVLTRLVAIIDTVATGDPFVAANAVRLQTIAWAVVALEVLHLAVGMIALAVSSPAQSLDLHWAPSIARWLVILLCFVLARVFAHGTQLRDELEGTV